MGLSVGIDIAKAFHWVAAVNASGEQVLSHRVENDPVSIEELIGQIRATAGPDDVKVGVDVLGGIASLLVASLQEAGLRVVHVPGLAVNRARAGTRGGENKSDPRDARVIADQVRSRTDLRAIEMDDDLTAQIRLVVGRRRDLVVEQTRRIARMHDLVVSVHPGLERALDLTNKADLWLLTRYVSPAELRRAGTRRVAEYLRKHGVGRMRAERVASAAVEAAKAQRIVVPGEQRAAAMVRELANEALRARERIATLEAEIGELVERHPDGALIRSLPGMGAVLTAELIAEAGAVDRFPTADRLAAAAGLAPVLNQSGKTRGLHRARGGNKNLKRVFYQSAFCSLQHPVSRAFYDRKRREGKRHHQAVVALARRRIDVLHAMLRTRQPFDPDRPRATHAA
jgi:transposase